MANQTGTIYKHNGTWFLKYRTTGTKKDGSVGRVHKTVRLCSRNGEQHHEYCTQKGEHKTKKSLFDVRAKIMQAANALQGNRGAGQDMRVTDFWETRYLPYLQEIVELTGQPRRKPSTVRGFKQIWKQHLGNHFGELTLRQYEPALGNRFLRSLTGTQGKATLKHIKALASSIFGYAVEEEIIKVNPWREVKVPKDAIDSESTPHYTIEEAENMISALVDHVDAQLVLALACFLGLRPGEIAALKWEDFDTENDVVYIRRSVVRGIVGTPKTHESEAPLPLLAPVRIPLELWRQKVERENARRKAEAVDGEESKSDGYIFESRKGTPVDLHNLVARVIRPHVEGLNYSIKGEAVKCIRCDKVPQGSGVTWKTIYAGRRCAATAVIERNNGNLAIGQALLRHKSQITTATFYKKAVTPETLRNGVKMLETAPNGQKQLQAANGKNS